MEIKLSRAGDVKSLMISQRRNSRWARVIDCRRDVTVTRYSGSPRGVENMRTMRNGGLRSIPKGQNDNYLEMYVLSKGKELLEREIAHSWKRRERAVKMLEELGARMKELESASSQTESEEGKTNEVASVDNGGKIWKVMNIDY